MIQIFYLILFFIYIIMNNSFILKETEEVKVINLIFFLNKYLNKVFKQIKKSSYLIIIIYFLN